MTLLTGKKGKLSFLAPFDKYNTPEEWTIVGIQMIPYLTKLGADILKLVYLDEELVESDYQEDIDGKIAIITIENESQMIINIPEDRIASSETEDGNHPYKEYGLAVSLPSLPTDYDLSSLIADVKTVVKEKLGFTVSVEKVELSATTLLNTTDHTAAMLHLENGIISKIGYKTKFLKQVEITNNQSAVTMAALEFAVRKSNE